MRFSAFISYNHHDRRAAAWLHRSIETYRVPRRLIGRQSRLGVLERRLPPVFQDRQDLAASGDLAASVRQALEGAAAMIVVCSPAGAGSPWVNKEIRAFTALGRRGRIQCLIVAGEPNASRRAGVDPALECLPPALFEGGAGEPLAADLRPGQDDRLSAKLKLLAGLLGVDYDELRQREHARRQRRFAVIAAASTVGFVAMSALAGFALVSRNEAVRQRDIARQKTLTAERTVTFVKSLFEVADPSESRGDTITAREILDRGARELDQGLAGEPTVKAELTTTLGEVYGGLGMLRKSEALLRRGLDLPAVDPAARARQLTALGEAQWRADDYKAAAATHQRALGLARRAEGDASPLIARNLIGLSDAQIRLGDYAAARRNAQAALSRDLKTFGPERPEVAQDYKVIGESEFFAGDLKAARANIEQALAIRVKSQGVSHPDVADELNTLGNIAHLGGDAASAEQYFRRALEGYEAVLGPNHPQVAGALNNVGRILLERRKFGQAEPLLKRAVAIDLAQKDDMAEDLVFEYANLGIAERGLGRARQADALFQKAEAAARINKHRNLAPVLLERAEIACSTGAPARGLQLVAAARPIMAADYPRDAWRTAWVEVVQGVCLMRSGRASEGRGLIRAHAASVHDRWGDDSLYGARLAQFLAS
ncbi:MAG TPA: toll/interleukin-1 receptor domain-containing protein [Phenylobacterium sp.]|nr:toll/interleukin-1 receptor domain-containing protein [Phenylobacterium sp.]